MKTTFRFLLMTVLTFLAILVTPSAFATPTQTLVNVVNDPCDGASTPDECMAITSANIVSCRARSCLKVLAHYRNNPDGSTSLVSACTIVYYNAACQCDTVTLKTYGACTYAP